MTTPVLKKTGRELRDEVEQLIRDDLIGPIGGDEEELVEAPIDQYLLGLLAPRFRAAMTSTPRQARDGHENPEDDPPAADALPDDALGAAGDTADTGEEGATEDRPPAVDQLVPSALGLTFAVDDDCHQLVVTSSWGHYTKATSEERTDRDGRPQRVWRRRPAGGDLKIAVPARGEIAAQSPDPEQPEVHVRGTVRNRNGHRLVSLFLVNGQAAEQGRSVDRWLCQASVTVAAPDGQPVFARRPIDPVSLAPEVDRDELAGLEMQYRNTVELAVGHGVAVQAITAKDDPTCGTLLVTAVMPATDVPRTDPPSAEDFADDAIAGPLRRLTPALDMKTLSEADDAALPKLLEPLAEAYDAWIANQAARTSDPDLAEHAKAAKRHLDDARHASERIRAGIAALTDPDVAKAFRFANHGMWQQRVHTLAAEERRRDPALKLHAALAKVDEPKNRSWRPFQLAFVLLNLPSLADPAHPERQVGDPSLVDLLFFPTGGGKTEAYLGLTAFAIAIRRLQGVIEGRDGRDGVAVLMRYTLRLLTLQQFQRAAALLCACELRRRALYGDGKTEDQRCWGTTPMRIGLWVGNRSTPNRTKDADDWVKEARNRNGSARGASPLQLARCPWCGSALSGGRDVTVDGPRDRTIVTCSDTSGQCAFTPRNSPDEGLPVVVVDHEIYRLLPALVIATVDKFARMPWEGRAAALFGQVSRHCERHGYLTPEEDRDHAGQHPRRGRLEAATVHDCDALRPPDLVIQDELHLITGPLGSLVGLYETAVDELCTWSVGAQRVRAKVVASTATIRRAPDQARRLFDRRLKVFPPPGLDARDAFFALQRDQPSDADERPGRRYLGICAPGRRYKQVLIRAYIAQLRAAWTVLGRQPGEDADAYMTLVGYFNSLRELGGMRRLVEDDVQSRLFTPGGENRGRLIIEELTSRKTAADIPDTLDQLGVRRTSREKRSGDGPPSIDVLLATNMISVGVDVPRLGAMVVAGQPKSTSEYIQATSRVGRAHPGLVMTVYNWARPRDLSHYETFQHYHRTLYRQVEALSVTPFAARAIDRGLTGVVASLMRLCGPAYNQNPAAGAIDDAGHQAQRAAAALRSRAAYSLGQTGADEVGARATHLLQAWRAEADVPQRDLVYARGGNTSYALLREPDMEGWDIWTVPTSMRNVENAVPLALRPHGIGQPSQPWEAPERSAPVPDPAAEA